MKASGSLLVVALLATSALGVARLQPRLAAVVHDVKDRDDVPALPPPSEMRWFALGYDAAAVDLLWAKLLTEYGLHWHEKREFHPDPYIDTIVFLEPTYRPIYRFVDTLLCYHPLAATEADIRKAREVLERGLRERPGDYEVWQQYGQFIAFLAGGWLKDDAERQRWRRDGAIALAHAVDLGADVTLGMSASTLLNTAGERDASIKSLQRSYIYTDDSHTRELIAARLARLEASARDEKGEQAVRLVESRWRASWPFLSRGEFLLIAPTPDAARCAGPVAGDDPACSRDWNVILEHEVP